MLRFLAIVVTTRTGLGAGVCNDVGVPLADTPSSCPSTPAVPTARTISLVQVTSTRQKTVIPELFDETDWQMSEDGKLRALVGGEAVAFSEEKGVSSELSSGRGHGQTARRAASHFGASTGATAAAAVQNVQQVLQASALSAAQEPLSSSSSRLQRHDVLFASAPSPHPSAKVPGTGGSVAFVHQAHAAERAPVRGIGMRISGDDVGHVLGLAQRGVWLRQVIIGKGLGALSQKGQQVLAACGRHAKQNTFTTAILVAVLALLLCAVVGASCLQKAAPGAAALLGTRSEPPLTCFNSPARPGTQVLGPGSHRVVDEASQEWPQALSAALPSAARPLSPRQDAPSPSGCRAAGAAPSADDIEQANAVDPYFCPDLVVPQSCECILLIPIQPLGQGSFEVTDLTGHAVLRVVPRQANVKPWGPASALALGGREAASCREARLGLQRLVLLTGHGTILAQCGLAPGRPAAAQRAQGRAAEFHILRSSGDYFAKLTRNEGQERYTLGTRTGTRLYFWGSFERHAANVTDDSGKLLATTEEHASGAMPVSTPVGPAGASKESSHYKLRVAPLMDVGLVLCGLLCIEHLS